MGSKDKAGREVKKPKKDKKIKGGGPTLGAVSDLEAKAQAKVAAQHQQH